MNRRNFLQLAGFLPFVALASRIKKPKTEDDPYPAPENRAITIGHKGDEVAMFDKKGNLYLRGNIYEVYKHR